MEGPSKSKEDIHRKKINIPKSWSPGMRFQGYNRNDGLYVSGEIKSRAGKATGSKRSSYYVILDQGDKNGDPQEWLDLSTLENLSVLDDRRDEVLIMYNTDEIRKAKNKEIEAWVSNKVMTEDPDEGQETLSARWVITKKQTPTGQEIKARLVVRGFEEDTSDLKTDSPTCSKENMRILLTVASSNGWKTRSLDVKSAYLQGKGISRLIFIKPPKEFANGMLWRLDKTVYGLCDAARAWYNKVRETLLELGMQTEYLWGRSLFYWIKDGTLQGILAVHVDDFLYAGEECFKAQVIEKFKVRFAIGNMSANSFTYLGLRLCSFPDGITIDQIPYADSLEHLPRDTIRGKDNELTNKEITQVRAKVGQLNWLSTHTRPDIAFEVSDLGSNIANPAYAHVNRINKVIDIVVRNPLQIYFPRLDHTGKWHIICYADAALAPKDSGVINGRKDDRPQGAHIIFSKDSSGKMCTIDWRSKRMTLTGKGPLAAELQAMVDASGNAIHIAHIFKILRGPESIESVQCFTDSRSLVDNLNSTHQLEDRFQRKDMGILQQRVEENLCSIQWVKGEKQLADAMTKRGVYTGPLRNAVERKRECN